LSVFPGLFLSDEGIEILRLRLRNSDGKAAFVEQKAIDEPVGGLLEVLTEIVKDLFLEFDIGFKRDVGGAILIVKEPPPRPLEKIIDQDSRARFLCHL